MVVFSVLIHDANKTFDNGRDLKVAVEPVDCGPKATRTLHGDMS